MLEVWHLNVAPHHKEKVQACATIQVFPYAKVLKQKGWISDSL